MKRSGKWRLLLSGPKNGPENMALDEALLISAEKSGFDGTLRLYSWEPACISLGYFQKPAETLDILRCKKMGIGITKRLTGGGAIYHHAEITYSITTVLPNPLVPANVDESYRFLEEFIIRGINKLGATAVYRGKADPKDKSVYCFVRPSKYDVVSGGKKLVGSAQRRSGKLFLQHGSILLNLDDLDIMFSVIKLDSDIFAAKKAFNKKVTALDAVLGKTPDKEALPRQLALSFKNTCNIKLFEAPLTAKEKELARSLVGKYTL